MDITPAQRPHPPLSLPLHPSTRASPPVRTRSILPAVVRAVTRSAVYVDTGAEIVPISYRAATRSQIRPLSDLYSPGQHTTILGRSIVATLPNPWYSFSLTPGDTVAGIVIGVTRKSDRPVAIIEITPGVIGTADLPIGTDCQRHDHVLAHIASIDHARRRIRLRIRRTQ